MKQAPYISEKKASIVIAIGAVCFTLVAAIFGH
jgi:hypothetical protein